MGYNDQVDCGFSGLEVEAGGQQLPRGQAGQQRNRDHQRGGGAGQVKKKPVEHLATLPFRIPMRGTQPLSD